MEHHIPAFTASYAAAGLVLFLSLVQSEEERDHAAHSL